MFFNVSSLIVQISLKQTTDFIKINKIKKYNLIYFLTKNHFKLILF